MTVTLPAPYGKADWTDYIDYWRDLDVTWLQDRSILRYDTVANRNDPAIGVPTSTAGQTIYLATTDRLEYKSSVGNWIGVLGAQNLKVAPINNTGGAGAADESVTISQTASAGGKGLTIGKDLTSVSTDTDLNGVLKVLGVGAAGHIDIKTGSKVVKLTTDATGLVSDSPFAATVLTAPVATIPTFNATSVTATGTIQGATVTGTTSVTGGALSMTSGTVGAVAMATGRVTAADGMLANQGRFYGTASSAVMRQFDTALGASYLEVTDTVVRAIATTLVVDAATQVYDRRGITYYTASPGSILGYGGPVIYSATDPGAANCPPGTIWVS